MENIRLGAVESRFADIIWSRGTLSTNELIKLAESELEWKRTTTYTVLKRLCSRGIFETKDGIVNVLISKNEFYSKKSEQIVHNDFGGSLPAFIAAFTLRKNLTDKEIEEIKEIIENMRKR